MSKKVVTLGEIMLRLSTPDFKRFVQSDSFDVTYGGGEANVAAALCNYGLNGTFVTKVPTIQLASLRSIIYAAMVWIHNLLQEAATA